MEEVIEALKEQSGLTVDPQTIIEDFILSNVEVLVVGKRGKRSLELQKILKKTDDAGNELGSPAIDVLYNTFPFLRFIPLPASRLIQGFQKQANQMMELLTNIAKHSADNPGIIHHLLKVKNESDGSGSQWFTYANMRDLLLNLVSAGTLMSAILLLAKRTDVQEKIQKELNEKTCKREILLSDREDCPYLEAMILETLRYISHVPLSIMHYTSVDCELRGYFIPKNSIVIPNLWTAHHSKNWGDPFSFRPERFLSESGELLPATHIVRKRLIPFGYGKRSCVGENFAKSRIFLFLANLLKNFSIQEPEDSPVSDFRPTDMIPGVVLQPKQYKVVLKGRNN